jgi:hypothetical protein
MEEVGIRSCRFERAARWNRSKEVHVHVERRWKIIYGGMACTVSEALREDPGYGFRVARRESLYITRYIILRHSERIKVSCIGITVFWLGI